MDLEWDENKRLITLQSRGLDFADASIVFSGPVFEFEDTRRDYGEQRMICFGLLGDRLVSVVYVEQSECRRIISMRKANEREIKKIFERLG
ncbi:BrnT family toxin [Methylococcus sp. ANG]|uniref:BrnT family toxin n=1 Tax=unclassified Methylococcus TaxID=2618889 RepID=UPI001C531AC3|nr:BrnT family toxin [Methylococcus sp. Mc7]